jgi:ankyrin repeat protein
MAFFKNGDPEPLSDAELGRQVRHQEALERASLAAEVARSEVEALKAENVRLKADLKAAQSKIAVLQAEEEHPQNNAGLTAIHWAIINNHMTSLWGLLSHQFNGNIKDSNGWTPLHMAAERGNAAAIRILLSTHLERLPARAGILIHVNERNNKGETALDVVKNDECEELLRQAGGRRGVEIPTC